MVDSKSRPKPGDPPQLDSSLEILRSMLQVEQDRLEVAREIEKERKIVFPETSVIVRDIMKIMDEIERKERTQKLANLRDGAK